MSFGKTSEKIKTPNRLPQYRSKNGLGSIRQREGKILFLLVIPVLVYVILFAYAPLWGLGYGFVKYRLGKPLTQSEFVGFQNFVTLFKMSISKKTIVCR